VRSAACAKDRDHVTVQSIASLSPSALGTLCLLGFLFLLFLGVLERLAVRRPAQRVPKGAKSTTAESSNIFNVTNPAIVIVTSIFFGVSCRTVFLFVFDGANETDAATDEPSNEVVANTKGSLKTRE